MPRRPDVIGPSDALVLAIARERMNGRPAHRIAAEIGVHPSELSRWLNGRSAPTAEHAEALARALGCEVGELFGAP